MLIIAGRIAQTYLYPLFEPQMVCGELLPGCQLVMKSSKVGIAPERMGVDSLDMNCCTRWGIWFAGEHVSVHVLQSLYLQDNLKILQNSPLKVHQLIECQLVDRQCEEMINCLDNESCERNSCEIIITYRTHFTKMPDHKIHRISPHLNVTQ